VTLFQKLSWASVEERALLMKHKPLSIKDAAAIPGVRASTLSALLHLVTLRRQHPAVEQPMGE
jgi:tRNA U34 5-carboxymethylaminomethyl modifying enzyme MnmG/GidA